jgi:PhnB protein
MSTGIAAWITVTNASDALAFYKAAFGAVDIETHSDPSGVLQVAQLWIGPADFWIQQDSGASVTESNDPPVHMILSVDEPDIVFTRSVAAGAREVNPMADAYGWRIGKIVDPFGHVWEIGRRLDG